MKGCVRVTRLAQEELELRERHRLRSGRGRRHGKTDKMKILKPRSTDQHRGERLQDWHIAIYRWAEAIDQEEVCEVWKVGVRHPIASLEVEG